MKFTTYSFCPCLLYFIVLQFICSNLTSAQKTDYFTIFDKNPAIASSIWGFSLGDAQSGEILHQYQSYKSFEPASTLKIISSCFALETLGSNYQFKTEFVLKGKLKNKAWVGDLIIIGKGDPSFGCERFDKKNYYPFVLKSVCDSLKKLNIDTILGNIKINDQLFGKDPIADGWLWMDIGNYYAPPVSAMVINENMYEIYLEKASNDSKNHTISGFSQPMSFFKFENFTKIDTNLKKEKVYIKGGTFSNYHYLTGITPNSNSKITIKGAIPDPKIQFSNLIAFELSKNGIQTVNQNIILSTKDSLAIFKKFSPLLKDIVKQTLLKSLNLYAENILKVSCSELKTDNSWEKCGQTLESFYFKNSRNSLGIYLQDGSGLSVQNLITPNSMMNFLHKIKSKPYFNDVKNSLPIAGKTGTLSNLFKNSKLEGNLIAKTGTTSSVKCFAGYIIGKSGNLYPFSLMINHSEITHPQFTKAIENFLEQFTNLQ